MQYLRIEHLGSCEYSVNVGKIMEYAQCSICGIMILCAKYLLSAAPKAVGSVLKQIEKNVSFILKILVKAAARDSSPPYHAVDAGFHIGELRKFFPTGI